MRKSLAVALTVMVAGASTVLFVAPAEAASRSVIIKSSNLVTSSADPASRATIKPKVSKTGRVKITSKRITVKLNGRTVASKKKSVSALPGAYRVTTIAKYRTYKKVHGKNKYSKTKTKSKTSTVVVYRACATDADFASVLTRDESTTGPATPPGDTLAAVRVKLHTVGAPFPGSGVSEGYVLLFQKCDAAQTLAVGIDATGHAYNKVDLAAIPPV